MMRRKGLVLVTLLLILAVALAARVVWTDFGLPYIHHWDEPNIANRALQILKTGDFHLEAGGTLETPLFDVPPGSYAFFWVAKSEAEGGELPHLQATVVRKEGGSLVPIGEGRYRSRRHPRRPRLDFSLEEPTPVALRLEVIDSTAAGWIRVRDIQLRPLAEPLTPDSARR